MRCHKIGSVEFFRKPSKRRLFLSDNLDKSSNTTYEPCNGLRVINQTFNITLKIEIMKNLIFAMAAICCFSIASAQTDTTTTQRNKTSKITKARADQKKTAPGTVAPTTATPNTTTPPTPPNNGSYTRPTTTPQPGTTNNPAGTPAGAGTTTTTSPTNGGSNKASGNTQPSTTPSNPSMP